MPASRAVPACPHRRRMCSFCCRRGWVLAPPPVFWEALSCLLHPHLPCPVLSAHLSCHMGLPSSSPLLSWVRCSSSFPAVGGGSSLRTPSAAQLSLGPAPRPRRYRAVVSTCPRIKGLVPEVRAHETKGSCARSYQPFRTV